MVERVTRKNKKNISNLPLTISAQDGLVDQNNYFKKQVASRDMSKYYLLKKGDFAYNKSYSNGFPLGVVKRLDNYEQGALSTLYIVFRPTQVNSNFLVSYYETNKWHRAVSRRSAEGARNHGLLNLSVTDFFDTELKTPVLDSEQIKIGMLIKKLENNINLHQRKINMLITLKQQFLSLIFAKSNENTPMIRFKQFGERWQQRKLGEISTVSTGKAFKSSEYHENGKYLIITNKNINDQKKGVVFSGDRIDINDEDILRRYSLEGNNVLITMDGVHIGQAGMYSNDKAVLAQRVGKLNSKQIDFIYQITQRKDFIYQMNRLSVGNAIKHISLKNISDYSVMVPYSENEQRNIGLFLKYIDNTVNLYQNKLNSLTKMKQVYLNKMFI